MSATDTERNELKSLVQQLENVNEYIAAANAKLTADNSLATSENVTTAITSAKSILPPPPPPPAASTAAAGSFADVNKKMATIVNLKKAIIITFPASNAGIVSIPTVKIGEDAPVTITDGKLDGTMYETLTTAYQKDLKKGGKTNKRKSKRKRRTFRRQV